MDNTKTLQKQFLDLLEQYQYASCCVDDAQLDFDRVCSDNALDSVIKVYKGNLNQSKRELRRSFDAIAQFCLDHNGSIQFV